MKTSTSPSIREMVKPTPNGHHMCHQLERTSPGGTKWSAAYLTDPVPSEPVNETGMRFSELLARDRIDAVLRISGKGNLHRLHSGFWDSYWHDGKRLGWFDNWERNEL